MGNRFMKEEILIENVEQQPDRNNPFDPRHYTEIENDRSSEEISIGNARAQFPNAGLCTIKETDETRSPLAGDEFVYKPFITVDPPSSVDMAMPSTSAAAPFFPGQITRHPRLAFSSTISLQLPDTSKDETWAQRMDRVEQWSDYYLNPKRMFVSRFWTDDHPEVPCLVTFSRFWPAMFACGVGLYYIGNNMLQVHSGQRVDLYNNQNPRLRWRAGNYCEDFAIIIMGLSGMIFLVGLLVYYLFSRDMREYYARSYAAQLQREEYRRAIFLDSGCGDGYYGSFRNEQGAATNTIYRPPRRMKKRQDKPNGKRDELEESGCYDSPSFHDSVSDSTTTDYHPCKSDVEGATCKDFDEKSVDLSSDSFRNPHSDEKVPTRRLIRYDPNHPHKEDDYDSDESAIQSMNPYFTTESYCHYNGNTNYLHNSKEESDSSQEE